MKNDARHFHASGFRATTSLRKMDLITRPGEETRQQYLAAFIAPPCATCVGFRHPNEIFRVRCHAQMRRYFLCCQPTQNDEKESAIMIDDKNAVRIFPRGLQRIHVRIRILISDAREFLHEGC